MKLALVLAVLILVVAAWQAFAQPQGGGRGQMGPAGMRGPGGPPMSPSLAVGDGAVFVLAGPKIYKFDSKTLELKAEGEIPRPEPPQRPEGAAGGE